MGCGDRPAHVSDLKECIQGCPWAVNPAIQPDRHPDQRSREAPFALCRVVHASFANVPGRISPFSR